jgi:1,4-dihydroxy-2-naphthoate octaprenyltransferase
MAFLRVILFLFTSLMLGCGTSAPNTAMDENAAKAKEEAEKKAMNNAKLMQMKNQPGWRPGQ